MTHLDKNFLGFKAPEIVGINHFLNTDNDLILKDLKDKVILLGFWTFSCINCVRTLPHLNFWHEKYSKKGLMIIEIHTPEFDYEKSVSNVKKFLEENNIKYSVLIDNNYKTWKAYNKYWSNKFLIDRKDFIKYNHIGEGVYYETEKVIIELLNEK